MGVCSLLVFFVWACVPVSVGLCAAPLLAFVCFCACNFTKKVVKWFRGLGFCPVSFFLFSGGVLWFLLLLFLFLLLLVRRVVLVRFLFLLVRLFGRFRALLVALRFLLPLLRLSSRRVGLVLSVLSVWCGLFPSRICSVVFSCRLSCLFQFLAVRCERCRGVCGFSFVACGF